MKKVRTALSLHDEIQRLKAELDESNETLRAIQSGEVDALIVAGPKGDQIFTLQSADHLYRILVETMSEGALTLDDAGVIFYCNQRFSEMVNIPIERLIGEKMIHFLADDYKQKFKASLIDAKTGRVRESYLLQTAQGREVSSLLSMNHVTLESGSGICIVATDLTERLKFEKSKEDVEKLNLEKNLREQFVSTLTHDLRNPLTAAKINAQLISRQGDVSEKAATLSKRIIHNIERADRMIQDLLDANRIRAGQKLPLEITECNLSQNAHEALEDLSAVMGPRFVLESPEPVVGHWSCSQLRRVIDNLATNAVKYGFSDTPITLSVRAHGDQAVLAVHNQGVPLGKKDQETLFKPFSRTSSAKKSNKEGWGLGLTLVRGVVEAHGGRVFVESAEVGTTFTVILPKDSRPFQAEI